jgi:hypothetical protein
MNPDAFQPGKRTLLLGVEMPVNECPYTRVDYHEDLPGPGRSCLFHHPLDGGAIDYRKHGFGKRPGGGAHPGAASGGRYDGYFNIHERDNYFGLTAVRLNRGNSVHPVDQFSQLP